MKSIFFLISFFISCTSIQGSYEPKGKTILVPSEKVQEVEQYDPRYSKDFVNKIKQAKKLIIEKKFNESRALLNTLNDKKISNIERGEKYNILGLIYFNQDQYSKSQILFNKALGQINENSKLKNQILLNLSASHYKKNEISRSATILTQINESKLPKFDIKKKHLLSFFLAHKLKRDKEEVHALINYFQFDQNRSDVLSSKFFSLLKEKFLGFSPETQKSYIEKYKVQKNNLAFKELVLSLNNSFKQQGNRYAVDELTSIVGSEYLQYQSSISYHEPIERNKIGLILPLTGEKSNFANKVLNGITVALQNIPEKFELVVKDSQNIPAIASEKVSELILQDNVSLVIGGLFSNTSEREYEAARKHGSVFLSLSQVNTSRFNKNKLLFEIQGSVESQVRAALDKENLSFLGSRVVLLYPNNELGHGYLDEFWNQTGDRGFDLVETSGYEKGINDFRPAIGKLSGIEFSKQKEREYRELVKIYKKENKDIEEIDLLKPTIEYDWVFIPSFPKEALQILPSFKYLGIKDAKFVGGPSWVSRSLVAQKKYLKNVNYVTDLEGEKKNQFIQQYKTSAGVMPKLLETLGFDTVYLARNILANNFSTRSELASYLDSKKNEIGYLGEWFSEGSIWYKKMKINQL